MLIAWLARNWKPLVYVLAITVTLGVVYRSGVNHGSADVEARWAAQRQADTLAAARADAANRAREAAQRQAAQDAETRYRNAQTHSDDLGRRNADLVRRLRHLTARSRDLPGAAADPAGAQSAGEPFDAGRASDALAGFAARCAREHDGLAAQVNGLIEAWPR